MSVPLCIAWVVYSVLYMVCLMYDQMLGLPRGQRGKIQKKIFKNGEHKTCKTYWASVNVHFIRLMFSVVCEKVRHTITDADADHCSSGAGNVPSSGNGTSRRRPNCHLRATSESVQPLQHDISSGLLTGMSSLSPVQVCRHYHLSRWLFQMLHYISMSSLSPVQVCRHYRPSRWLFQMLHYISMSSSSPVQVCRHYRPSRWLFQMLRHVSILQICVLCDCFQLQ